VALVGDVIQGARELIPDPAPVLGQPAPVFQVTTGGSLPAGNYFAKATFRTPWGETLPSSESGSLVVAANGVITATVTPPSSTTFVRIYFTTSVGTVGAESMYTDFAVTSAQWNLSQVYQVTAYGASGVPPTRSTAYNPDLDGGFVSANALFRWLGRGLEQLSRTCGGLRTYAGVGTQAGNPLYVLPANWNAITDIWYDGYWMQGGQRGNFFRRNAITASILTSATISVMDNRTVIEVYPQPIRSGGVTTLSAPMGLTDTTASVTNGTLIGLLPFGFVQVDTEIMAYSSMTGTTAGGLIRGLGGSVPSTHISGAPVTELNLAISGRQVFNFTYTPGQSGVTLPVPPGWDDILIDYVMYMARSAEQDTQSAKDYLSNFSKKTAEWGRTNTNPVKRRQIGPSSLPEAYYGGVPGGGGWLIP
jgi:hypothetical protein